MTVQTAFVTGATGLLGNNLVRLLVERDVKVRALARSRAKADRLFSDIEGVDVVVGDMTDTRSFAGALSGADILFHTAAYFRDSYKGGSHRKALFDVNVTGTRNLVEAAYKAGIRRMVHTSSIAVLNGPRRALIDETMLRAPGHGDDYYQSKVEADRAVLTFLDQHPDFHAAFVLPGWMHGPGDSGPTAAGQSVIDFLGGKIPGVTPGTVSFVDARDVALAEIAAAEKGRRGERYLAAGREISLETYFQHLEKVSGVAAPTKKLSFPTLYVIAMLSEFLSFIFRKPALLSLATVRQMRSENERQNFDSRKAMREFGVTFRPIEETLADEIAWYRANGMVPPEAE